MTCSRHTRFVPLVAAALTLSAPGCRERAGVQKLTPDGEPLPITFRAETPLLFVYADLAGKFRRVQRVTEVPVASRSVVRVIDPTVPSISRRDDGAVHLVDLTRPSRSGEFTTRLVSLRQLERRALAALPPGASSRIQLPGTGSELVAAITRSHDQVILYGTNWCGACKRAREFFRERNVDFVERNVEHDAEAAAELAQKAADVGIVPDRVPAIDVRGSLLVGFDQTRLETLLGESV